MHCGRMQLATCVDEHTSVSYHTTPNHAPRPHACPHVHDISVTLHDVKGTGPSSFPLCGLLVVHFCMTQGSGGGVHVEVTGVAGLVFKLTPPFHALYVEHRYEAHSTGRRCAAMR